MLPAVRATPIARLRHRRASTASAGVQSTILRVGATPTAPATNSVPVSPCVCVGCSVTLSKSGELASPRTPAAALPMPTARIMENAWPASASRALRLAPVGPVATARAALARMHRSVRAPAPALPPTQRGPVCPFTRPSRSSVGAHPFCNVASLFNTRIHAGRDAADCAASP